MILKQTKELQEKLLEIITFIDDFCRKNNITYYLSCGSALGAVRHKGFIPWDDDLDIMMSMEDYIRFKELFTKLPKGKYVFQDLSTEKNYYMLFGKVRDVTTTFIDEACIDKDIISGVYIDIFPLVGVPKQNWKKKVQKISRAFAMSTYVNVINNNKANFIFKCLQHIFGKKRIYEFGYRGCVKFPFSEYDDCCSIFDGDGYECNIFKKCFLGEPKYVDFENIRLPIPQFSDKYLSKIYGDYMKIPKEDEQRTHEIVFMDLHNPYTKYFRNGKYIGPQK